VPSSVRVLFFASAREAVGRASVVRTVPADGAGLTEFLDELAGTYPRLREVLRISRIVRNGEFVARRMGRVAPGDEIAIHPPYSGG
jgi:molybdopterin converting factor small subunit